MKILMVVYDNDSYTTWFPQGLGYLASAARNVGHEVSVYQQDIYHWEDEHLTQYLDNNEFNVVMVSLIGGYYQYNKLLKLSKAINSSKNRNSFKYLIGGHGPAAAPEYFLKKTKADFVGIGECEVTIVELLDAINEKKSYHAVNGIAFLEDDKYIKTKPRELIKNVDDILFPAYDLFDMTYYSMTRGPNMRANEKGMPVLSGRGCTFKCNFCYRMDKGFRPRSAESIISEVRFLKEKYNINYIDFSDELLMDSKKRTLKLSQAFIDSGLNFHWICNGRLNYADIPVLEKMKEAGCVFINYGIESLDNDTLKIMHKHLDVKTITEGIENTIKVGISPGLNIIFGNINEPLSALDRDVEFLLKYDDHAQLRTIRPVTPYPGSELFDIAVERGLLKDVADFYENKHLNSDLLAVNFTQHSDDEVYSALYKANTTLINRHIEVSKEKMNQTCKNLYHNKDITFRGFRQT